MSEHYQGASSNFAPLLLEWWKPIAGWESLYQISNSGAVYSIRSQKRLNGSKLPKGYLTVDLQSNGRRVTAYRHCLVAAHYIGPRPPGMEINHIDGYKPNCRSSNLEYLTPLGNMQHAKDNKLVSFGDSHYAAKLNSVNICEIRKLLGSVSHKAIGEKFGVTREAISRLSRGETWASVK